MENIAIPLTASTPFMQTAVQKKTDLPSGLIEYMDFTGFDHDKAVNFGEVQEISIRKFSKSYHLESFQCTSEISDSQSKELMNNFGIDIMDQVISVLNNEDTLSREKNLAKLYYRLGAVSQETMITPWQKRVRKIFKKLKFPSYATTGEEIMKHMVINSNRIHFLNRRGKGNFAIVSPEIGALLMDSPAFVVASIGKISNPGEMTVAGSCWGMTIFVDHYKHYNDSRILVGRQTLDGESGVYVVNGTREILQIEDPMRIGFRKVAIRSRIAFLDTLNAEKNFISLDIELRKRPWWRKLFKL